MQVENGEVGWVNLSLVQQECEDCGAAAADEVTDSKSSCENHNSLIGFYSMCIRKTLEGKLKNDPIPFAFYTKASYVQADLSTLYSHDLEHKTQTQRRAIILPFCHMVS